MVKRSLFNFRGSIPCVCVCVTWVYRMHSSLSQVWSRSCQQRRFHGSTGTASAARERTNTQTPPPPPFCTLTFCYYCFGIRYADTVILVLHHGPANETDCFISFCDPPLRRRIHHRPSPLRVRRHRYRQTFRLHGSDCECNFLNPQTQSRAARPHRRRAARVASPPTNHTTITSDGSRQ